jgi:hypothetical protein
VFRAGRQDERLVGVDPGDLMPARREFGAHAALPAAGVKHP